MALDVFAASLAEIGRADDDDLEALPGASSGSRSIASMPPVRAVGRRGRAD
jgi:hypothetical protein